MRTLGLVRRAGASRPAAALTSQAIVAGSSLLLQVVASRQGSAGLGRFSLLLGVLATLNAIASGFIGDSLTVLDRFDPGIRRALVQYQFAAVAIAFGIGTMVASLIDGVHLGTALWFGAACSLWGLEETGRRTLIARRTFWALVVNDVSYAVGSLGYLAIVASSGRGISLQDLVVALAVGAALAIAVAVVQLPSVEISLATRAAAARRSEVAGFAVWRAAQVGLRPAALAIVRAVVVAMVGVRALGELEGARLVVAPMLTVAAGAGVYLLPTYSAAVKQGTSFRPRVTTAMTALGLTCVAYGLVATLFHEPLSMLLTDGTYDISATSIAAWSLFSAGFAAGIPAGNAVVARGRSRRAFLIRSIDAGIGIACASAILAFGWTDAVPVGLALGTAIGAGLLLTRTTPSAAVGAELARETRPEVSVDLVPANRIHDGAGLAVGASTSVLVGQRTGRPPDMRVPSVTPWSAPVCRARLASWWLPLLLIVATEYKFRRRPNEDSLSGTVDAWIALELGIYALVGVYLLVRLRPNVRADMIVVWTVGYGFTAAVSAIYAPFPLLALVRAAQMVIIVLAVLRFVDDSDLSTVRRFLHGYIVLVTVSVLIGTVYVAPTTIRQVGRFTWLSTHSVVAGAMLAVSVVVVFGMWLTHRAAALPWARWVYGALTIVHVASLLRTRTRGSIGAAAIAMIAMALMWLRREGKRDLLIGSIISLVAVTFVAGGPILSYLLRDSDLAELATFNRRTEIWSLAFDSFISRPLHGLGLTAARGVFFDETGLGGAHNAFINVVIDLGLVGLFWWIGLIGLIFAAASRLRRVRPDVPGGTRIAFDSITITGVMVAQMVNGLTAEFVGSGVSSMAILLFITGAWAIAAGDDLDALDDSGPAHVFRNPFGRVP